MGLALALATLLGAASLAEAAASSAQKPADTYTDQTTTLLVEVPVEVTHDGKPVRGLTAENFVLFDNGRQQVINNVDVVDLAALSAGEDQSNLPVAARRHFLILFDYTFSTPGALEKAREAAFGFVAKDLHPTDLVAVGTFSTRDGIRIPLAFTPDRTQVQLAIQALGQERVLGIRPDPLRIYIGNKSQLRDPGDDATSSSKHGSEAVREQAEEVAAAEKRGSDTRGRREVKILSDSMQGLAKLLRQVNGRKHVIYFSSGFDSSLLLGTQDSAELEQNSQATARGELWKVDSDNVFGNRSTLSALDQLTDALRKSDCTLHAVDVAGLRAGGDLGLGAGRQGKDGLFLMSRDTGGELFENFNDLGTAMNRLLEKTSVTYLLSYRPKDLDFDGKYRKLKVKLKDVPEGRIVYRPGYFAPDDKKGADDFGTLLASADELLDRHKGAISAQILALPMAAKTSDGEMADGRRYVPTFIDVEGASFLGPRQIGRERPKEIRADVFLYAFDSQGGIVDYFSQAISLDLTQLGSTFDTHGFRLYAPLLLGEGEHTLRALVRNPATGRSGVAIGSASVSGEKAVALLPPMLPEATDEWILVRGRRKDLEDQTEPDYPFAFSAQTYAPAAGPHLMAQERLPLLIAGWGLQNLQIEARFLDEHGEEVAPLTLDLSGKATMTESGMIQQLAGFSVPKLEAGTYQLELSGKDAEGKSVTQSKLAITVEASPAPQRKLAFAAPQEGARERMASADAPPVEDEAEIERSVAGLRDLYRQALQAFRPNTGAEGAVDGLEQFELAALGDDPRGKANRLGRAEMDVARKLAGRDVESILPLLQVHQELFLRHKAQRRPYLEIHSGQMVQDLAALYAERGKSQGSRVVASRALSSLGGYWLADGRSSAAELLEKAAAIDPGNEAAYLGLAAYYEKRGGPYDAAAAALERLVEHRPESREGRLRLAINLVRLAKSDRMGDKARLKKAEEHFRALLAAPDNDWVTSLAAQELARFEAGQGHVAAAAALLEKTLLRRPADQELLVQLTFFYDRLEKGTVPKLFDRVSNSAEDEAPRGRYNSWQSEALVRDRGELSDGARQRLEILDQTLAKTQTQEGR